MTHRYLENKVVFYNCISSNSHCPIVSFSNLLVQLTQKLSPSPHVALTANFQPISLFPVTQLTLLLIWDGILALALLFHKKEG